MLQKRFALLLTWFPAVGWCQKPVVFPGGVVNAASYSTMSNTWLPVGKGVSQGGIVTAFGSNLAASIQIASVIPLPTELGGTSVTVDCVEARLFYVSPGQINFQMPSPNRGGRCVSPGSTGVVVSTVAGQSDPYALDKVGAPGIFTSDASACGQGTILNLHGDGTVSLNSLQDSVSPGEYISIYGTGLGPVYNWPLDGMPAQSTPPLATAASGLTFDLDFVLAPQSLLSGPLGQPSFWAGRAPGLVGVDQFNFLIPNGVREGCTVPVQVGGGYGISQPVTMSIRSGGGQCADPPYAGYGQITWEKTIMIEPPSSAAETSTALTVSLQSSPGRSVPSATLGLSRTWLGPSCPIPGYLSLDAGAVTIQGPGLGPAPAPVAPLQEGQVSGLKVYQASLPDGTIQPGTFGVSASGGVDVGEFQSAVTIGSEIHIVTALAGRVLVVSNGSAPSLTFTWTGGDPDAWVTARFVRHLGYVDEWSFAYRAQASAGTLTMDSSSQGGFGVGIGTVELVVEVTPGEPQPFSAPGLSLGGQHLWKYTYRYQGLLLQ